MTKETAMTRTQLSTAVVVVVLAAGCGHAAASGSSASHATTTQTSTAATGDDVDSTAVSASARRRSVRRYLKDLHPVWREIARVNVASHHAVKISGSGNFPAMAATTRQMARHLARAAALARAITPPPGLKRAHADLTRAFAVGNRMARRLSVLYDHIGPDSQQKYHNQILPLEKRAVRLGNRWLQPTTEAMLSSGVVPPGWIDHLFDWS
jgi:hypothetical protein